MRSDEIVKSQRGGSGSPLLNPERDSRHDYTLEVCWLVIVTGMRFRTHLIVGRGSG